MTLKSTSLILHAQPLRPFPKMDFLTEWKGLKWYSRRAECRGRESLHLRVIWASVFSWVKEGNWANALPARRCPSVIPWSEANHFSEGLGFSFVKWKGWVGWSPWSVSLLSIYTTRWPALCPPCSLTCAGCQRAFQAWPRSPHRWRAVVSSLLSVWFFRCMLTNSQVPA